MLHRVFITILVITINFLACMDHANAEPLLTPSNPKNVIIMPSLDDNIAKNKIYSFEQPPLYSYCTDPADLAQLTDGKYTIGHFWTQFSTVGWVKTSPVIIEIDLETVSPISGVSYSTAAGVAGVRWPWAILIFVSNDSNQYQYVGDLIELDLADNLPKIGKYAVHKFWTTKLSAIGRYVKLIIVPNGPYTFVDEIEVFKHSLSQSADETSSSEIGDLGKFIENTVMKAGVKRRFNSDIESIRKTLGNVENRKEFEKTLDIIKNEVNSIANIKSDGFSTAFPINDIHRKIFKIQAAVWRQKGFNPITLWQKNRWDMISPTELPTGDSPSINVKMMRNEYRSVAFNISNAGDEIAKLNFTVRGLPGGVDPDYIKVHASLFTDTAEGVPVMAALPTVVHGENGYTVEIDPGLTRQIWLTFNSKSLSSGTYMGEINIEPNGLRVPVTLKVYPFNFPDKPRLHLGGWDYTNAERIYDVTPENRDALIKHMKEHYVDTPWATSSVLARGKYDKNGNMTELPDTQHFETWLQRWPDAENYFVYVNAKDIFCGLKMGTPSFKRAVANWIDFWVNKIESWDIKAEQIGLLLVDEPANNEKSEIAIQYAKAIKSAAPKVVIFEDVAWKEPWEAPAELFGLSDVLCVSLSMWDSASSRFLDFYEDQRIAGRELWFYSYIGSAKLLDPYGYHRLQQWFSWQYDAKGSCFWAFGDSNGSSSWNEYLAKSLGSYTPLFLDSKSVTAGKHMEAIREGVEDYEYLSMLRDRIDELESASKTGDALSSAKNLLSTAAERVIQGMDGNTRIKWSVTKDREVADKVIEEILEALMSLENL